MTTLMICVHDNGHNHVIILCCKCTCTCMHCYWYLSSSSIGHYCHIIISLLCFFRNHFRLFIKKALFVPSIVVTSSLALIVSRIWIAGGRLPSFTAFDNPTSFSDSPLTRVLTYAYLACYNFWLLLCPSRLCFDWSMGSIPFVESIADWRNLFTVLLFVLLTGVGVLGELPQLVHFKLLHLLGVVYIGYYVIH